MPIKNVTSNSYPPDYPIDQRQTTLADVLTDPLYDDVHVWTRWHAVSRTIIVAVHATRALSPAEFAKLRELVLAGGERRADEVFAQFEAGLDQPLTFVASVEIRADEIPIALKPKAIGNA